MKVSGLVSPLREWRRRAPWASALALVLLLAADSMFLGPKGAWKALQERTPRTDPLDWGVTEDRLELRRLSEAPPEARRAVVVGSSRANAGFELGKVDPTMSFGIEFHKVAHAYIGPFEMRSMVEQLVSARVDVVVLVLSEFDLSRPLQITPTASFGSFSAVVDLGRALGLTGSWSQRRLLYRLALACLLKSYRYRSVLHRAFVDDLRRFALDDRFPRTAPAIPPFLFDGGEPTSLGRTERREVLARLANLFPDSPNVGRGGFAHIRSITRGEHSRIQRALVRLAVERFHAAGVVVVISEAPLHPIATELYDATIRQDLLDFASRLVEDYGVRFVPLDAAAPYDADDFADLMHLGPRGAERFTRSIVAAVAAATAAAEPPRDERKEER